MPINIHILAPYKTNGLHLKIAKTPHLYKCVTVKSLFTSPLWYTSDKYLLRTAFPFNRVSKLPPHHRGSSPTALSKSTESFLLTLADSWSSIHITLFRNSHFSKFLFLGRHRTMPPGGNLGQYSKTQATCLHFIMNYYTKSTKTLL